MYSPDDSPKPREKWVKLPEAATILGCSQDTIRRALEMREMDYRRAGKRGHYHIEEQELHRWWKGHHRLIKRTSKAS